MKITLFTRSSVIGKRPEAYGGPWTPVTFGSLDEIIEHWYVRGHPLLFETLATSERKKANWLSTRCLVVDFDGGADRDQILTVPVLAKNLSILKPSSSWTPENPRYHGVILLNRPIETLAARYNLYQWLGGQVPFDIDRTIAKNPVLPLAGTRFTAYDAAPALGDGLYYLNPTAQPLDVNPIMAEIVRRQLSAEPLDQYTVMAVSRAGAADPVTSKRTEQYYSQPPEKRIAVAIDALRFVASHWGWRGYDEWLALWLSAHSATDGSPEALKILTDSDGIDWDKFGKPGARQAFFHQWHRTRPARDGYTVATLFYLAREAGWLTESPAAIADYETFYSDDVSAWMNQRPITDFDRALIVSGTGSGKTQGAITHLKRLQAQRQHIKAVFFAPSIKLCESLSAELTRAGVENILYRTSAGTLDKATLKSAEVLVSTLQTFGVKVFNSGYALSNYDLVVIDESDELITGFVRAGSILGAASHITPEQERAGMRVLSGLMRDAGQVILLDGTATQISQRCLTEFSPPDSVRTFKNTWVRTKAPVTMLRDLETCYTLANDALENRKRLVVAADTRTEAEKMLAHIGERYPDRRIIIIHGELSGEQAARATRFFRDVNVDDYDVLIYNSAMGSGVSVTEVTAEVLIQINTFLPPRKCLQILNRFRRQGDVYCFQQPYEALYNSDGFARISERETALQSYADLLGVPLAAREYSARISDQIFALAVTDQVAQDRSRTDFYRGLLADDGRVFKEYPKGTGETNFSRNAREKVNEARQAALSRWPNVPPLPPNSSAPDDMTQIDLAAARLHWRIIQCLRPDGLNRASGVAPELVAERVRRFGGRPLTIFRALADPEKVAGDYLVDLSDSTRAVHRIAGTLELAVLASGIYLAFPDMGESVEIASAELSAFVARQRATYDRLFANSRDRSFKAVSSHPDSALRFARNLAGLLSLTIRKRRGKYRIANLDDCTEFLEWCSVPFNQAGATLEFETTVARIEHYRSIFATFAPFERQRVVENVRNGESFVDAVKLIQGNGPTPNL